MRGNTPVREIYKDYQYKLIKSEILKKDFPELFNTPENFERMARELEKLESLIDLYVYHLAQSPE